MTARLAETQRRLVAAAARACLFALMGFTMGARPAPAGA